MMKILFAYLMALSAYSFLSFGFVLQKKGIQWIGWKGKKDKNYYKHLSTWIFGFVIVNIYGVPSAIALKTLPPHMVSAFAGWGIVMLVFLSYLILKEKLLPTDYLYSLLIVVGIVLLALFETSTTSGRETVSILYWGLVLLLLIPVILFLSVLNRAVSQKIRTIGFAAVSGMTAGLMVVSLRLLVLSHGYEVAKYLGSIYLYLYIFAALLSLVSLQLALKNGEMIAVGPVQYSSTIIYPLLATLIVFKGNIHLLQIVAVGIIVFSVIKILKKH
jgi:drug/metabolite transporter (DMT)-like permease